MWTCQCFLLVWRGFTVVTDHVSVQVFQQQHPNNWLQCRVLITLHRRSAPTAWTTGSSSTSTTQQVEDEAAPTCDVVRQEFKETFKRSREQEKNITTERRRCRRDVFPPWQSETRREALRLALGDRNSEKYLSPLTLENNFLHFRAE